MSYRIATPDEDLGEHSLEDLLSAYTTEASAAKVSVMPAGGMEWTKLWPWLERQRAERAAARLAVAKTAEAPAPRKYRAPFAVAIFQTLAVLTFILALISFGGALAVKDHPRGVDVAVHGYYEGLTLLGGAFSMWVAALVLNLLARIEFNTRR